MQILGKNARFWGRFRSRYIATEAPLDANGATFGLRNLSRCNAKRPKTDCKSGTFECQQTLNRPKTAFSLIFPDGKILQKSARFFSNGGRFEILSYEFWVLNWDFWEWKMDENE